MAQAAQQTHTDFDDRARYDALMDVVRNRITTRAFDPSYVVPKEHYELILEAARHSPSGANAQPWHFIIVTEPETDTLPPLPLSSPRPTLPFSAQAVPRMLMSFQRDMAG